VLQIIYNENTNEQCNFKFTLFKKYLQIAHWFWNYELSIRSYCSVWVLFFN
jgi:hypothetical protein